MTTIEEFDYLVIGGGSGGMASARRAATYGAKVAIIEGKAYGGTCVNVGCVPKKVMYNTAHVAEVIAEAKQFGFTIEGEVKFDWGYIKKARDTYITRLNRIYENNLDGQNIKRIQGYASFVSKDTVRVGDELFKAKHILVAVGGAADLLGVPGDEYLIDSDGFFELTTQPKKVGVIGAGYIAVELAGVFHSLGTDTTLVVRGDKALRKFDTTISQYLHDSMVKSGLKVVGNGQVKDIVKESDGTLTLNTLSGEVLTGFDVLIRAIGRHPLTEALNLPSANVNVDSKGRIVVDEYQNTSSEGVYALGDVCGKVELTPMAIAAGRRLSDRLFGNLPNAKADYTMVPTVVFSHPVIGTVGDTEVEAVEKYGKDNLKIYNSTFVNLWYGNYYGGAVGDKPYTKYKLICLLPDEKVVGLHAIGMGSDEVLQGFSVAMKMGATKADFDNAVAIHPTAAEEFVTLAPWGLSSQHLTTFKK